MPQLETVHPVLLDLAAEEVFPLSRIVECYAERPAHVHGLFPRKGSLCIGADADFVVVDPNREMTIDAISFESTDLYSPFDRWTVTGVPTAVYQRGEAIAENLTSIANPGDGEEYRSVERR